MRIDLERIGMEVSTKGSVPKKKKGRKKKIIVMFTVEIVVLMLVLGGLYVHLQLSKINTGNKLNMNNVEANPLPVMTKEVLKGYTTIALFGLDMHEPGDFNSGNSDVIIVANINNDSKEVKLASIYRDTYLDITDDDGFHKANAAYSNGGPEQAISMLNVNLDLDIKDYVSVDFNSVAKAVDLLKGVEVEVTAEEAAAMRGFQEEIAEFTGLECVYLEGAGTYNLDGVQATAFARVRQTSGSDFKRTERQRLIIEKMVEKALKSDLSTINELIDQIFPDIQTSFNQTELLLLIKDIFNYKLGETMGFPADNVPDIRVDDKLCVVSRDLKENVIQLHKFLFNAEGYHVTSKVEEISDQIEEATGVSVEETSDTEGESTDYEAAKEDGTGEGESDYEAAGEDSYSAADSDYEDLEEDGSGEADSDYEATSEEELY
jgi:LCP family protein required for cell wall assembly